MTAKYQMTGRRSKIFVLAAALCAFAFAAAAQTADANKQRPRESTGGARAPAPSTVNADAPNARLAALIRYDAAVIRTKGVAAVQRIDVGVYCITPTAATGIVPSKAIVTLTPEYYYSQLNEIKVQWAALASGCGSNRIGVYTLADVNADGIYRFSNLVGFSIVVP